MSFIKRGDLEPIEVLNDDQKIKIDDKQVKEAYEESKKNLDSTNNNEFNRKEQAN